MGIGGNNQRLDLADVRLAVSVVKVFIFNETVWSNLRSWEGSLLRSWGPKIFVEY